MAISKIQVSSMADNTIHGRRNLLINSGFDIWQRGVSQTSAGYGSVDRFSMSNSTSSFTTTRQSFATGQTDVPNNPLYYLRCVVSSGGSAGNYMFISQAIEGVQNGAGQTVTLSFYAKASSSLKVGVNLQQVFGTNGSSTVSTNGVAKTLSTSWARYTVTTTLPSISSKTIGTDSDNLRLLLWLDSGSTYNTTSGSIGNQSGTFEFSNIQLEVSSVATLHERLSLGETLGLCQRYYEIIDRVYPAIYSGSTTLNNYYYVEKRGLPVMTADSNPGGHTLNRNGNNSGYIYKSGGNSNAVTTLRIDAEL